MSDKPIRIVVIKGSVRPNNYTSRAVALVVDELRKDPHVHVQVIDPAEYNLPLPGTGLLGEGDLGEAGLVEDPNRRPVLDGTGEVVDVDVVAEHLAR